MVIGEPAARLVNDHSMTPSHWMQASTGIKLQELLLVNVNVGKKGMGVTI